MSPALPRSLAAAVARATVAVACLATAARAADDPARGTNHWAFRPLARVAPPVPDRGAAWIRTPVDAFVLARLRAAGLEPAPPADRATWLRRVTFDLTGLPPTPAELDAFARDRSPGAEERVVDRLLASPRHGQRWARHWLDVVRFGESQGFEYDRIREHAWRYRDWVVDALNADLPYDQFVREQVAGDVHPAARPGAVVATGFLVAGPYDQAGNGAGSPTVRAAAREAELEDMVGTTAQTFLGLTLNCARCHAHKFDPLAQRDYYRVKAVFQGVRHGDRALPGGDGKDKPMAYAANPEKPGPTAVLARGEPDKPREAVTPGAPDILASLPGDLGLAADSPEGERRARLADWIARPDNALAARTIVNRVWQHHFGRGLASTPNDLGHMGAAPSHPELLDWLAGWFVDPSGGAWRPKRLHRLIVLAATYRQASGTPPASDAEDRLLSVYPSRRLEAEAARDAMLFVSGALNEEAGGPGFRPFRHVGNGGQNEYFAADLPGPAMQRRTVYRIAVHSARDPLLDALDCPEFSTRTPVRPVTTTPLQALSLMNGTFVQRQAAGLAARCAAGAGRRSDDALRAMWRRALSRDPRPDELAAARALPPADVAWALLNSNEFLFVR